MATKPATQRARRSRKSPETISNGGIALVVGSADGVWEEIAAAQAMTRFDAVVAVNDMIGFWPGRLDVAVSLHPEKIPEWLNIRASKRHTPPVKLACHSGWTAWFKQIGIPEELPVPFDLVTSEHFSGQVDSGSSGLFGVKVALEDFGFSKIICCGIPMEIWGAHFRTPNQPWATAHRFRVAWEQALPHLSGRVRSMSGWTAGLLGKPDEAWLAR